MYIDSLIVRRVPKWIRERTHENMEVYNMCLSDSFEEAIKNAINLGYDTDTAGAVTGSEGLGLSVT